MNGTASIPGRLLRIPSDAPTARIFCFPYSGVGASMFNQWPRLLDGGTVEVCPIQLPARENRIREPHFGSYEELAANVVDDLLPYLDRPFVFFGHCAGSLPAFETAARLARLGLPVPARLVVSAQVAPHDCPHDRFLEMSDPELTAELNELVVARGGRPHPALTELTLHVLHRDLDANRAYTRAGPVSLPCGIEVLNWSEDTEVAAAQLTGWAHYADEVRFTELGGGHYEFLSAPAPLLEMLRHAALRQGSEST